jgi:hypothetical protein
VRHILEQVDLIRRNASRRCRSPRSCVMRVTGPDVYLNGLYQATREHGRCRNTIQRVVWGDCPHATDDLLRRTYVCPPNKEQPPLPRLHCSATRHLDCRKSGRTCSADHWQRGYRSRSRTAEDYFMV